jgi:hypothetical protein
MVTVLKNLSVAKYLTYLSYSKRAQAMETCQGKDKRDMAVLPVFTLL